MEPCPWTPVWVGDKPLPATNAAKYRAAVVELAEQMQARVVVEVGVYEGALTKLLARVPSVEELWAIDHWRPHFAVGVHRMDNLTAKIHMDATAKTVTRWAKTTKNVKVLRLDSLKAVTKFRDGYVDLWHTDGLHHYAGVTSDIRAWWPKVREGGALCGDNFEIPDVARAVDELLPHRTFMAKGRVWVATKAGALPTG